MALPRSTLENSANMCPSSGSPRACSGDSISRCGTSSIASPASMSRRATAPRLPVGCDKDKVILEYI